MIVNQIETELAAISQQLRSITVEIDNHRSGGSGIIWSADGLIVTNSHVVRGSKVDVKLENERVVKGSVIARDNQQDLALIKVEAEKLPIPNIGNSQLLRPGEIVLAMGSPWGFRGALATGVIHTTEWQEANKTKLNGTKQTSLNQTPSTSAIVADIRLAPGNSGGVLANVLGEVIGINTAIYRGLALAIPSHQIADFIKSIP
ncbi:Trypsin-like serine protease with C-terminal PDZ domain (fragment) [Hyella patelloides LEGE 07179]|uniref:Trypsin-like serine protease with C-terminal PDZ domain n=1 Tax=Hyella patelloides LEGE 07179 TaxID=945734 RepID=A0A563VN94_9CYAN